MHPISIEHMRHCYGSREALAGVSLRLEAGEIFALLGPNGGGKSTLFRVLATLLVPTGGRATILGHDVVGRPAAVRRAIGVTFQTPSLDGKLTVRENLMHQGHLYGLRGRALSERIREMLALFGLTDRERDAAETLSGGLARRVDLAKALMHRPPVLLLDEPSTGLDPGARRELFSALERTRAEHGTTVFLTTHLMEEAARCDRVGILDLGQLVACGKPGALMRAIGKQIVTLVAEEPEALASEIEARFGGPAFAEDGGIRLEREDGAALLHRILSAFPDRVTSATVAQPSLEDVFFRETGRLFDAGPDGADPASGRGAALRGTREETPGRDAAGAAVPGGRRAEEKRP